ncbi:CBS domain-containing protein [Streptomyces sp. DW26H14]|uniref:CBS domain-containing protein n=1 Tax=Streptomyces sp. DW26H14 TaxID=3435395 RepID=UPI00403DA981
MAERAVTAGEMMVPAVIAVGPGSPQCDVLRRMNEWQVRTVPVVAGDGRVVGVWSVSGTDTPPPGDDAMPFPAAAAKAGPALTVGTDATVDAARRLMSSWELDEVPVTDREGHLMGMLGPLPS